MGWISYHVDTYKGKIDRKSECDKLWMQEEYDGYPKLEVLKSVMKGSTYYAAVQNVTEGITFGIVVLTRVNNKDYCNFAYKEMDETMGPGYCECPDSILKLLSPTENEFAIEWRKNCAEYNAKRKAKQIPSKLAIGTKIRFKLGNGEERVIKKMSPSRQFKRTWWWIMGSSSYFPATRIPEEFEIIQ